VPVDGRANSLLGHEIDGSLANDLGMQIRRREFSALGHSGKIPQAIARVASYGDDRRPAQIQFNGKKPMRIWDAKDRRDLSDEEAVGQRISFKLHLNMIARVRFVAKVMLSAGYYIYGDCFRRHADHDAARRFMNVRKFPDLEMALDQCMARGNWDSFPRQNWWDVDDSANQALCKRTNGSVVIMVPLADDSLLVSVGLLGAWIGSMTIPVDVEKFPLHDEHDLGQVTAVIEGKVQRHSYRQYMTFSFPELLADLALPIADKPSP
jgi:hypothetical protein